MYRFRLSALACVLVMVSPHAAAQLYKCVGAYGKASYSDMPCPSSARPTEPRNAPPPLAVKATGGKLTSEAVAKVIDQAAVLAVRADYRAQCALAAPGISFTVTDHSSSPPLVLSGGRSEICALQRESAHALAANGLHPSIKLEKMEISLNADQTQATARYEAITTLTHQGRRVLVQRCVREEVLGLYGRSILYAKAEATCRPTVDM
jgi:hypothetical protein